jgi:myosin heavy subunit
MKILENLNPWALVGTLLLVSVGSPVAQPQTQPVTVQPAQSVEPTTTPKPPLNRMNRPLRLSVTVDDQSFLQVKEGDPVKEGDTITDNKRERDRLTQQRKSIRLHIQNLKDKAVHQPFEPKKPIPSKPLPPAIFSEEEAAISHAQLKLIQAQSVLEARTVLLVRENPEKKALVNKADTALSHAEQKVEEQEQMIKSMKDMKLQDQILQHEEAKLKQLKSTQEQAESELESAKAQLSASKIEQQQQLQQLHLAVQIAQSELEGARSKLTTAQSRRRLLEYDASIEQAKRAQMENQTQQEYSRQQQQYEQAVRDRDYQVAQLSISLSNIDDKLSQIPVVRSPRNGYIRRIDPWVGNNGKYTTTVVISSTPVASSPNGASKGEKSISPGSNSDE